MVHPGKNPTAASSGAEASELQWLNKSYRDMTDDELWLARSHWSNAVADAAGWPSAYFAAKQLEQVVAQGVGRGFVMSNPYPIKRG